MGTWNDYFRERGHAPEWPYQIRYDQEQEIETDVLVVGGGIAGCWAAISAARQGLRVALVEKGDVVRSGAGGPGCDHWCDAPANPLSNVDPDEWAEHSSYNSDRLVFDHKRRVISSCMDFLVSMFM